MRIYAIFILKMSIAQLVTGDATMSDFIKHEDSEKFQRFGPTAMSVEQVSEELQDTVKYRQALNDSEEEEEEPDQVECEDNNPQMQSSIIVELTKPPVPTSPVNTYMELIEISSDEEEQPLSKSRNHVKQQ